MTEGPIDGSLGGAEFPPDPEPVAPDPEPASPDSEPVVPDPEPASPDSEPVVPDPEPVAPEPEPIVPEPEPIQTDDEMIEQPGRPMTGWLLIALGALLLVGNLFHISGGLFLSALGGAFLAGYFSNRRYGLLIPAMILIFLGIGVMIEDARVFHLFGFEIPLLLGMGFMAIWLVDRFTWNQSSTWPLWPGGILVIIALWGIAVEANMFHDIWWEMMDFLGTWWPALLIIWGIFLLGKRGGKTGTETGAG